MRRSPSGSIVGSIGMMVREWVFLLLGLCMRGWDSCGGHSILAGRMGKAFRSLRSILRDNSGIAEVILL